MAASKKTESIFVRVSQVEKACLEELASLSGLSLSRFLAVSGLSAEAPSKEILLRRDMALFQLRRTDLTLREIKKVLKKQKSWSVHVKVVEALHELDAALKGMGAAWSGK